MPDTYRDSPHEHMLDTIYEALVGGEFDDGFVPDFFGQTIDRGPAVLYVKDPDGNCWEILAVPHSHKE